MPFDLVEMRLALVLTSPMREDLVTSLIRILADQGEGVGRRVVAGSACREGARERGD